MAPTFWDPCVRLGFHCRAARNKKLILYELFIFYVGDKRVFLPSSVLREQAWSGPHFRVLGLGL